MPGDNEDRLRHLWFNGEPRRVVAMMSSTSVTAEEVVARHNDLVTENRKLRERITALEGELDSLGEELNAAEACE